jgi:hypothetical protein
MKRTNSMDKTTQGGSDSRRSTPWHAVSIVTGPRCCHAAQSHLGTRFLSAEAPRLPLPECTFGQACLCSYKHHGDRRGQPRRRDDVMGLRRRGYTTNERRSDFGRREDDAV